MLFVGESPENEGKRVIAQEKNSYGPKGKSLVFSLVNGAFEWCGVIEMNAEELMDAQPRKRQMQRKNAMEWLRDYLKDGPARANDAIAAAEAVGIPLRTLERAEKSLGVLSAKDSDGAWYWRLSGFERWERDEGF